jgi:DNA primase
MSFDSDNAGAKAAERGWALALSCGMNVKIAEIPKGFDPADLILKDKDKFKEVLKNSISLIDFLLNRAENETKDKNKLWEIIKNKILPYIYLLDSNTERSRYIKKISNLIDIKEDFIWDDLKKVKLDEEFQNKTEEKENKAIDLEISKNILRKGSIERNLASIIIKQENDKIDSKKIKEKIKDILGENDYKNFEEELKEKTNELTFEAEGYYEKFDKDSLEKEAEYLILNLREDYFKKELEKLLSNLKIAEKNKATETINSISLRLKEIMQKISEIKKEKNNFYKH